MNNLIGSYDLDFACRSECFAVFSTAFSCLGDFLAWEKGECRNENVQFLCSPHASASNQNLRILAKQRVTWQLGTNRAVGKALATAAPKANMNDSKPYEQTYAAR